MIIIMRSEFTAGHCQQAWSASQDIYIGYRLDHTFMYVLYLKTSLFSFIWHLNFILAFNSTFFISKSIQVQWTLAPPWECNAVIKLRFSILEDCCCCCCCCIVHMDTTKTSSYKLHGKPHTCIETLLWCIINVASSEHAMTSLNMLENKKSPWERRDVYSPAKQNWRVKQSLTFHSAFPWSKIYSHRERA